MSIDGRLKKLEAATPNPGECLACRDRVEYTFSEETEPLPPVPVCEQCGRPVYTLHVREVAAAN